METKEIKPGAVVELKSGGPDMTVARVAGDDFQCCWFDHDHHVQEGRFPSACLKVVHDGEDVPAAPYLKPELDQRLASITIEELDNAYERIRYVKPPIPWTFHVDGEAITLTATAIYKELEARGASPIPF